MKEIKIFLGYIIFRIYRHGIRLMKIGGENWEWGGYFYFLGIPTIITSFILTIYVEDLFNLNDYFFTRKSQLPIAIIICLFNMYIISLFIPFKKVKNLTYTPEERVKYRNVFWCVVGYFCFICVIENKRVFVRES